MNILGTKFNLLGYFPSFNFAKDLGAMNWDGFKKKKKTKRERENLLNFVQKFSDSDLFGID